MLTPKVSNKFTQQLLVLLGRQALLLSIAFFVETSHSCNPVTPTSTLGAGLGTRPHICRQAQALKPTALSRSGSGTELHVFFHLQPRFIEPVTSSLQGSRFKPGGRFEGSSPGGAEHHAACLHKMSAWSPLHSGTSRDSLLQ